MSKRFRVLLVEDDDPLRDVLMEILARRGWTVHAVREPLQAFEIARHEPVDFSVLDLHLPGASGLELLVRIRREIRPMPSIMMSGAFSDLEFEAAQREGVFDFLRKPLQLPTFEQTIDQLIRAHFETLERAAGGPAGFPPRFLKLLPPPTAGTDPDDLPPRDDPDAPPPPAAN